MSLQVLRHLHNWSLRKEKLVKIDGSYNDQSNDVFVSEKKKTSLYPHADPLIFEIKAISSKKRKAVDSFACQKSLRKIKKMDQNVSLLNKFYKSKHANKSEQRTFLEQRKLQKKLLPISKKKSNIILVKKSMKCQYCFRRYPTEEILFKHKKVCTLKNTQDSTLLTTRMSSLIFPCDSCCERFMNQEALDQHLKCEHRSRPSCNKCFKMFECRRKLIEHDEFCAGMLDGKPIKKQTHGLISFICTSDIHMCSKCENPFPSQNHLRQHQILLRKKMPIDIVLEKDFDLSTVLELDNCNENEETSKTMEISLTNVVSFRYTLPFELGENVCTHCGKLFQNYARLLNHGHICKKKLAYSCFFCSKMFRSKIRLDNHLSSCLKRKVLGQHPKRNLTKLFSCQYCKLLFPLKSLCKHHMRTEHKNITMQRNFQKCYIIKSKELAASSMKGNFTKKSFKSLNKDSYIKPLFGSDNILTATPATIFSTKSLSVESHCENNQILCKHCDYICTGEEQLANHVKENHSIETFRITKCKKCFKVYVTQQDLNNHICKVKKISDPETNLGVPCNASHEYITDLKIITKESPVYTCLKCSQIFKRRKLYLRHTQDCEFRIKKSIIHTEKSCDLNQFCYICGFTFDNIVMHLTSHSHKRPFNCIACKYRSNRAYTAYKHMHKKHNIVHGPFNHKNSEIHLKEHGFENCANCHVYFLSRKDLYKHTEQDCINFQATIQNTDALKCNIKLKTRCINCSIVFHSKKRLLRHLKFCPFKNINSLNGIPSKTARGKEKRCHKCLRPFKYKLPFLKHINRCTIGVTEELESQIIKPAGPAIESLLAENEEADVDVGVLVSLEDAKESLMSLIVDDKCCKEDAVEEEEKFKEEISNNDNIVVTATSKTTATSAIHNNWLLGEMKNSNEKNYISDGIFCKASMGEFFFLNSTTCSSLAGSALKSDFPVSNTLSSCSKNALSENINEPTFVNTFSNKNDSLDSTSPSQHSLQTSHNFSETKSNSNVFKKSQKIHINFANTLDNKNSLDTLLLEHNQLSPKCDSSIFNRSINSINNQSPKSDSNFINKPIICTETKNNLPGSPSIVCSFRLYPCRKCCISFSEPELLEKHVNNFHKILPEVNPTIQNTDDTDRKIQNTDNANTVISTCKPIYKKNNSSLVEKNSHYIVSTKFDVTQSGKLSNTDDNSSFYSMKPSNEFGSVVTEQEKDFQRFFGNHFNDRMTISPPIGEDYRVSQFICSAPHKNHDGKQYASALPFSPVIFDPTLSTYISNDPLTISPLSYNTSSDLSYVRCRTPIFNPFYNSSPSLYRAPYPEPHNSFVISHRTPPAVDRWPYHNFVFPQHQPNFTNNSRHFAHLRLQTEISGHPLNKINKIPSAVAESIHPEIQVTEHQILDEQSSLSVPTLFLNDDSDRFVLEKYRRRFAEETFVRHFNSSNSMCGESLLDKSVSCMQIAGNHEDNVYSADPENNYKNKAYKPNFAQNIDTEKNSLECFIRASPPSALPNKSVDFIKTVQEPFNCKRNRRKQSRPIRISENQTTSSI